MDLDKRWGLGSLQCPFMQPLTIQSCATRTQGGEQGGVGADNAPGERCILGTKGRQLRALLSPLELGELGVLVEGAAPLLRPHAPFRQPASSLPSGQSCSWLQRLIAGTQAPSPHWNSSPRQVPRAARTGQGEGSEPARCWDSSPTPPPCPPLARTEPMAELGDLEGHPTKALPV